MPWQPDRAILTKRHSICTDSGVENNYSIGKGGCAGEELNRDLLRRDLALGGMDVTIR
jgi:hypothetical protein